MTRLRSQSKEHPIEKVGRKLRGMMSWLKPKEAAETAHAPVSADA